jgi:hypothetical protein
MNGYRYVIRCYGSDRPRAACRSLASVWDWLAASVGAGCWMDEGEFPRTVWVPGEPPVAVLTVTTMDGGGQ